MIQQKRFNLMVKVLCTGIEVGELRGQLGPRPSSLPSNPAESLHPALGGTLLSQLPPLTWPLALNFGTNLGD